MNLKPFEIRVPGKWVLAGEHAVLRGATAVALPHPELGLQLAFQPSCGALSIQPEEFRPVVEHLLSALGCSYSAMSGKLIIKSDIPVGGGFGSSAALCVALTAWLAEPLGFSTAEQLELAQSLENQFHGRSSGMDIAAVSACGPISFVMNRGAERLNIKRLPNFTFHDTGLRTRTSDCVAKVQDFFEKNPILGKQTDALMHDAACEAIDGLTRYDLVCVAKAMQKAQECFSVWGLVPPSVKSLEEELRARGALGVKLTGAGGGGFLVALWG
jgi:mevalonate kinase